MAKGQAYKDWWAANKQRILEERKKRYHDDPDVRAKAIKASAESRKKARKEAPRKIRLKRPPRPRMMKAPNGSDVEVYQVGALSQLVQRTPMTLAHWEQIGLLPVTPLRDGRGVRMYTREQMQGVKVS